MDAGTKYTDKKIKKVESQLENVYTEAYQDISKKLKDFTDKYAAKDAIYQEKVKNGEMSEEDYKRWEKGQVFQGKQWQAKKDQIAETITHSNKIASKIVNGEARNVFAANANYMAYDLEHGAGINFGFGIYDGFTVAKLVKDDPKLLPEWKINEPKDYIWNQKNLNNALTQGIIQGEGIEKVANRVATSLSMKNKNMSFTFARTAMTGAQNAGRDQSLMDAKAKGIKLIKQWMATLDNHTRDTHAAIDGETIKVGDKWHPMTFSNGCRYPGDPNGPAHEVYNCRCTLVGDIEDYPETFQRYDNIDGHPVDQMTYKEWYKAKYGKEFQPSKVPQKPQKVKKPTIDYGKYGGKEVYDLLSQYESFDDLVNHTTPENYHEFQKIVDALGGSNGDIDKAIKEIHEMSAKKNSGIDYSKYGNEEALKVMQKYDYDFDKIVNECTTEEWDKIWNANGYTLENAKKWTENAKADKAKIEKAEKAAKKKEDVASEETEEEKQKKAYEKAKADLDKINQEIKDKGADEVITGIWQKPTTYADYEEKKNSGSLDAKKQYYNDKMDMYEKTFLNDVEEGLADAPDGDKLWGALLKHEGHKLDAWNDPVVQDVMQSLDLDADDFDQVWIMFQGKAHNFHEAQNYLNKVNEFEKHGEEYSKLLKQKDDMQAEVSALRPKPNYGDAFGSDAYTQERKDNAVWAKSREEADSVFRPTTENVWADASQAEKYAAWDYTAGSGKFNRPTRGYDGAWYNYKGIGNVSLDNERAEKEIGDLTNLLEKSRLKQDTWLQRGVETLDGLANFVGVPKETLRNATQEELEQLLLGKTISDAGFMSCGSSKGTGFSGSILNIYCPAGTQGLYVEPFSEYTGAHYNGKNWDGKQKQNSFGRELETLLQRNSDFVITKVEKGRYGQIYLDIDLIGQDPHRYDAEYAKAKKR